MARRFLDYHIRHTDLSGILIRCEESKREEIAKFFEENFEKDWSDAMDAVEEEYGDCMEKEDECGSIATVSITEDGVLVLLGPLYLSYDNGDYIESEGFAYKALKKSLKRLINNFPDVSYEGYIGYTWSDQHGGEAEQWEISSDSDSPQETDKVYPFIGELLSEAVKSDDFWDNMIDNLDGNEVEDLKKIIKIFYAYKEWLPDDCFESLFDLSEEVELDDVRSALEEYLSSLENGDGVDEDEEESDEDDLPEGYMDALNAIVDIETKRQNAEIDDELADEDDE